MCRYRHHTVFLCVASLQQKHCPMLSDMSVVAWLLVSDQSHLNISFWFTWFHTAAIKPGHRINNHGFACLWLQKDTMETWGCLVSIAGGGGFFWLWKKKNSPLDRSNYSHNLLLLWSVCYQGRHICGGERKAEKCLFLHHPWQKVSVHFIFVNAFFKLHKSLCLWP